MALQKSTLTETEIIKAVCLKRQFQSAYSAANAKDGASVSATMNDLSSKDNRNSRKDQLKLALKIWTASSKFIKSQCNKGRIVDTLLFGTFARADTIDSSAGADYYVYCPGPKALFKLGENKENILDIRQSVLDEKLIQLNVSSVAQVCGSTVEAVQAIMSAIRDEIVESIFQRKANISLNFGVGVLSLFHSGNSQFKSNSIQEVAEARDEADRVKECTEFETKSRLTEEGLKSLGGANRVQSASQISERTK